ncbi:hypothetical protein VNO77_23786 [Canavalia gladiata]|uniref:Uncharacterized protein n=1 Tax=Canavalia gladiata TaxID=3824 RepID=A0AAN9QBU9_CANGL
MSARLYCTVGKLSFFSIFCYCSLDFLVHLLMMLLIQGRSYTELSCTNCYASKIVTIKQFGNAHKALILVSHYCVVSYFYFSPQCFGYSLVTFLHFHYSGSQSPMHIGRIMGAEVMELEHLDEI